MESKFLERMKDKSTFKTACGFKYSTVSIMLMAIFAFMGVVILFFGLRGHGISQRNALIAGSASLGAALTMLVITTLSNRMKCNRMFQTFIKSEKKVVPAYFIQEYRQRNGSMAIDVYAIVEDGEVDDDILVVLRNQKTFNPMIERVMANGMVSKKEVRRVRDGIYLLPIFAGRFYRRRERIAYIDKMIVADDKIFYPVHPDLADLTFTPEKS